MLAPPASAAAAPWQAHQIATSGTHARGGGAWGAGSRRARRGLVQSARPARTCCANRQRRVNDTRPTDAKPNTQITLSDVAIVIDGRRVGVTLPLPVPSAPPGAPVLPSPPALSVQANIDNPSAPKASGARAPPISCLVLISGLRGAGRAQRVPAGRAPPRVGRLPSPGRLAPPRCGLPTPPTPAAG